MAQNTVKALELSTLNATALTTSYQAINGTGFLYPVFYMRIVNDSNQDITISYDGTTDHEYVPSGDTFNFPSQSNAQPNSGVSLWSARTVVYVKAGAAGTGTIALSGYYN